MSAPLLYWRFGSVARQELTDGDTIAKREVVPNFPLSFVVDE